MNKAPPAAAATQARVLIPFVIVTLIWGSTWLVIRDQLGAVPPAWSISYRFVIAGLTMLGYALLKRESLKLDRAGVGFAVALGISQFVLNYNFVYLAEIYVTSGLVAVVFALLIVPNALFGRIFLGHSVSGSFLLGSGVAIAGVVLLFIHEAQGGLAASGKVFLGIALTLLGVVSASAANVMQATERSLRYPMAPMLTWAMLIGAALNAVYAWATAGPPVIETRPGYIIGLLYLGVIASAIAFTLYFGIIRVIGPARAAYSSVLIPVIAMLLSTVFEGYRWSLLAAAGCGLAFAGLVIALRARSPAR